VLDGLSDGGARMVAGDRGQAFTLEGFIAAILVLTALLFALQSVVLTPSTGGEVGGQTERSLQQQATDVLVLNAESGNLSRVVRYWQPGCGAVSFHNASSYGYENTTDVAEGKYGLGTLLNQTFAGRGQPVNVVLEYRTNSSAAGWQAGQTENATVLRQGLPDEKSLVATYTLTLYDDQELTAPGTDTTLGQAAECSDPAFDIPDASPDSHVYNVVVVKVVVL
jgi:hypothetical protein